MKRAVLLCLALTFALAAPATAETFTVNTTADTEVPGGCDTDPQCSLRDAITAASGADGNTVVIPAGTYTLNTPDVLGDLDIDADMTITGAGARGTIVNANRLSRVFNIASDEHVVSISGLTVTGGLSSSVDNPGNGDAFNGDGGGILTFGALTLTDVAVSGNQAALGGGGIFSEPVEQFLDEVAQPLTLVRTTVSGNTVDSSAPGNGQGGGIASFGELSLTNSTVHGNSVTKDGMNEGGGIVSTNGLTSIVNSTITGNSIASPLGLGGGISLDDTGVPPFSGELQATNTIVAGNTADGDEDNCALTDTTLTDNNISGDDTCGFTDAGSKENTNPQLFALRDNFGPTNTQSFPLSSPALDAGTSAGCPGTDQRGVPRPQRGTCDIGAVELAPPTAVTGGVSGLGRASATLLGRSVNPFIEGGAVSFDLGTTTAYGRSIPAGGVAAGATEPESVLAGGLAANTTYHYRIVVTNRDGTSHGEDRTFTTRRALTRPTVRVAGVRRSCVRRAFNLRVRVRVASGTRLRAVRVTLDGRTIRRTSRPTFTVRVNAALLSSGRHTLRVKAVDRGSRTRTVTRRFSRCARIPVARPRFTG